MTTYIIFTVIMSTWFLCGAISFGLLKAFYINKFDTSDTFTLASITLCILGGPIDLIATLIVLAKYNGIKHTFKYGIKLY